MILCLLNHLQYSAKTKIFIDNYLTKLLRENNEEKVLIEEIEDINKQIDINEDEDGNNKNSKLDPTVNKFQKLNEIALNNTQNFYSLYS